MKGSAYYALLGSLSLASAQTFSGFFVDIQQKLEIIYGDISVNNGQQLPRAGISFVVTLLLSPTN
jgi:hypothetical protein